MSDREFRCSLWARLLPYALATGVLLSAMLAGYYLPPRFAASRGFRALLTVTAGAAALWILRRGGELKQRVRIGAGTLELAYGPRSRRIALDQIEEVRFRSAFSRGRNWLPATVLIDGDGLEWRLSALLRHGDELVAAIGEAAGRGKLASWIEARGVIVAMRAVRRRLLIGYGLALGAPLASVFYGLWG